MKSAHEMRLKAALKALETTSILHAINIVAAQHASNYPGLEQQYWIIGV
jgi:hypothetical protein